MTASSAERGLPGLREWGVAILGAQGLCEDESTVCFGRVCRLVDLQGALGCGWLARAAGPADRRGGGPWISEEDELLLAAGLFPVLGAAWPIPPCLASHGVVGAGGGGPIAVFWLGTEEAFTAPAEADMWGAKACAEIGRWLDSRGIEHVWADFPSGGAELDLRRRFEEVAALGQAWAIRAEVASVAAAPCNGASSSPRI